jgi:hypothetical protein
MVQIPTIGNAIESKTLPSRSRDAQIESGARMIRSHPRLAWLAAGLFAVAALFCVPLGLEAESLLSAADDPVAIADRGLARAFDGTIAIAEINAALDAHDADLAQSFVDLADDRGAILPADLKARVKAAVDDANSAGAAAGSFASGLITGEPKDMAGLAGTALGDLFVFGDIRDAVREGSRYASGENYDQLILGLSVVGIAITAGTYATAGAAGPARVGLTAVKVARKTGRLSARLGDWISRSVRDIVDWSALKRAGAAVTEPAVAVRAAREAVKVEKADGLVRLVSDVGRVQTKAGTQAALDGLKLAEGPREMSRVAALAEKKGSKTRAILKTLGRGAILLSIASFNLAAWVLGAILTLFGLVSSAKSGVERMTLRHLARKKERKALRYAMMAQSRA